MCFHLFWVNATEYRIVGRIRILHGVPHIVEDGHRVPCLGGNQLVPASTIAEVICRRQEQHDLLGPFHATAVSSRQRQISSGEASIEGETIRNYSISIRRVVIVQIVSCVSPARDGVMHDRLVATGVLLRQTAANHISISIHTGQSRVIGDHHRVVVVVDRRPDYRSAAPGSSLVRSARHADQRLGEMPGQIVECDGLGIANRQSTDVLGGVVRGIVVVAFKLRLDQVVVDSDLRRSRSRIEFSRGASSSLKVSAGTRDNSAIVDVVGAVKILGQKVGKEDIRRRPGIGDCRNLRRGGFEYQPEPLRLPGRFRPVDR